MVKNKIRRLEINILNIVNRPNALMAGRHRCFMKFLSGSQKGATGKNTLKN